MGACTSSPDSLVPASEFQHHFNPQLYHGNDSYLLLNVAMSQMFQDHLISLIEQEGYDTARFPNPAAFTYNTETIFHALWGSPFSILYQFLVELGLTPKVLLEPQVEDKDQLWSCSLSTYEDIDWISLFLSEALKVRWISKQCDLTILNFGRMLVMAPRLFRYCDQGSMSSTVGQCRSASSLKLL